LNKLNIGNRKLKIASLHSWDLNYASARRLQTELAGQIRQTPFIRPLNTIAGIDCAFSRDKKHIAAVVVVLRLPDFELIEQADCVLPVTFPYIPGLLSFREAPACLAAVEKLKTTPDVFIIDGQGIAHPRRLGLASHLGLFLNRSTIGCAKSRLIGDYDEPIAARGSSSPLKDKDETIGAVLRTKSAVKPLFVSVGHLCTLDDALRITLQCCTRYRLPEPSRLAHQLVTKLKTKL
jgi:deoxyribonuclease V